MMMMIHKKELRKRFNRILKESGADKYFKDEKHIDFLFMIYSSGFNAGYLLSETQVFESLRDESIN